MGEQQDMVLGVHLFPIKSLHEATVDGQFPAELTVGPTGFEHNGVADRMWVVREQDGLFVSGRGWDEKKSLKHNDDKRLATVAVDIRHDHLLVSAEGHGSIQIPLDTEGTTESTVRIFGPELPVIDECDEPAQYFSDFLQRAVRLAKADSTRPRLLDEKYRRADASNRAAGADGRPFSIASHTSLDYLHDVLGWKRGRLPISQFRSNIEIDGRAIGAFGEDRARAWRIGSTAVFYETKALPRCPEANINQETGDNKEKLATKLLGQTRMGWSAGADMKSKPEPHFAQSLNHKADSIGSTVAEGDPVVVGEWGEPNFVQRVRD